MLLNLNNNLTQQEKELKPKKKSDLIYQNVQMLQRKPCILKSNCVVNF